MNRVPSQAQSAAMQALATAARKPLKGPWQIEIDVYLDKAGSDPQFRIESALSTSTNDPIVFHNNHRPGFLIAFNLHDETKQGYVFAPVADDACWSQAGESCPDSPVCDVFNPLYVTNGGTTLVVYNNNPSPPIGPFKYTLRVTNDEGQTFCELDPPGDDQNGPRV